MMSEEHELKALHLSLQSDLAQSMSELGMSDIPAEKAMALIDKSRTDEDSKALARMAFNGGRTKRDIMLGVLKSSGEN